MRKVYAFLIFALLFCNVSKADKIIGKGDLKFNDEMVAYFMKYLKTPAGQAPLSFFVAMNDEGGWYATYWYCPEGNCKESGLKGLQKQCNISAKKNYNIVDQCFLFAKKRYAVWENGINPAHYKKSSFKSKWSKREVIAKLTELGFYGNSTSSNYVTTEEVKKLNQETYLCSVWQASSIKITSQISDKTRCTDIFYKKTDEKVYYTLLPFNNKTISNDKYTSLKNLQTKSYELKGERSIALSWEGYEDLIAGSVKFDETDYRGTLELPLPNNDGSCDGTYSLQEGGKGTWQIACTNKMGAAGTLKWIKDGGITGIGRDHNDKKVKFTVSKDS